VCYFHLEKFILLDCSKVLTFLIHYRDKSVKQNKISLKSQSATILKKWKAGNNFLQPTSGLIDINPKHIIAGEARIFLKLGNASRSGEARNSLKLGFTSPSLKREPHFLVDAPS
jgi:hypothetical protein